MEPWEENLLAATREFVMRMAAHVPPAKRQEVITRIYSDMRRTLKLFHQDSPKKPGAGRQPGRA